MNTTKNTRSAGAAAAIILGFVVALTPGASHANQTSTAATMLPTGPDIALSAADNLRQVMEADRVPAVSTRPGDTTLRELMEADSGPEAAIRLLPPTEADRPSEVPDTEDKTLRQLMEEDRR